MSDLHKAMRELELAANDILQLKTDKMDLAASLAAVQEENTRLKADIEKFWFHVEHAYDIEPREYFEKEARTNGFDSPLAQAAHHISMR